MSAECPSLSRRQAIARELTYFIILDLRFMRYFYQIYMNNMKASNF